MQIAIYGAGYVGLVSSLCFAQLGHEVICLDINENRIALLSQGKSPIYEEGLENLLQAMLMAGRLFFTSSFEDLSSNISIHIIATGTPSLSNGGADLSQVYSVISSIVKHTTAKALLVIKSTVPVGTGESLEAFVQQQLTENNKSHQLELASNPEFLREGTAISDFLNAERIVVGGNAHAITVLRELYQPLITKGIPFLTMSRQSAELAKYASNAFLACKISFINQISQLAEPCDANVDDIRSVMGLDSRIGSQFLNPGIGYGGSCFPKDVRALVQIAGKMDVDPSFFQSIDRVNDLQKTWVVFQIRRHFNKALQGLKIGFWGLAFKPGTDDLREASSLVAIDSLLNAQVTIYAYDPSASVKASEHYSQRNSTDIQFCTTADSVLEVGLDALVIATEWQQFKSFPLEALKKALGKTPIFDGRNCYALEDVQEVGLVYYSVGRPVIYGYKNKE